jgi:glycosyltransferase involved in cell wall biosynthesis
LNQTYKNLEIVIVNDGSTDNTDKVANSLLPLDSRIKYISIEKNTGKWFALNEAINFSKGLIVTCHDADDVSLPQRIERQFKALQATDSVHNLCGFHHCYSEEEMNAEYPLISDEKLQVIPPEKVTELVRFGFNTPGINHYYTSSIETAGTSAMFLKAIWNVGLRFNPPNVGLRIANSEDSDFNTRLTLALCNTSILAEKLYLYRRGTSTNNESR